MEMLTFLEKFSRKILLSKTERHDDRTTFRVTTHKPCCEPAACQLGRIMQMVLSAQSEIRIHRAAWNCAARSRLKLLLALSPTFLFRFLPPSRLFIPPVTAPGSTGMVHWRAVRKIISASALSRSHDTRTSC